MKIPYHSALSKGQLETATPLEGPVQDDRGNWALVWDVNDRTPPDQFYECDLIYAEPSWPAGLAAFDERAGVETPGYAHYADSLRIIVEKLKKPTAMFISSRALRRMPMPDLTFDADLNGNLTPIAFWNGAFATGSSNKDIIRDFAKRHNRVGDFCCGYGTTGRLFSEAGKRFVMSDYNALCAGYVAEHMGDWGR